MPLALGATVVVVTLGAAFLADIDSGGSGPANAAEVTDVRTDLDHSPPRTLIAAGRTAMSAYWQESSQELGRREHQVTRGTVVTTAKRLTRIWHVYNPRSDAYEKTEWSWVDVAPGLRKAAVLKGELPSKQLGILDLATRKVVSWVDLPRGAASASWSSDGKTILATSYDRHPDEIEFINAHTRYGAKGLNPRTGFYVVDAATLEARFNPVRPGVGQRAHVRNDFRWASPGTVVSDADDRPGGKAYYGLDGTARNPADLPDDQAGQAGTSPGGKLVAGPAGMPTRVTERSTGRHVGTQQVLDLVAWADDERLIALGCEDTCADEFRNALVLVSVDGEDMTRLSAFRASDQDWHPVFTSR